MQIYSKTKLLSESEFIRDTGIKKLDFEMICLKVSEFIDEEKANNSLKRRGKTSTNVDLANRILLTFYYMRHHPTFVSLGHIFGISESYCNKIYHKYLNIIAKVQKLPNRHIIKNEKIETIIIDATEQPIECPKNKQKKYYSGKKKTYD